MPNPDDCLEIEGDLYIGGLGPSGKGHWMCGMMKMFVEENLWKLTISWTGQCRTKPKYVVDRIKDVTYKTQNLYIKINDGSSFRMKNFRLGCNPDVFTQSLERARRGCLKLSGWFPTRSTPSRVPLSPRQNQQTTPTPKNFLERGQQKSTEQVRAHTVNLKNFYGQKASSTPQTHQRVYGPLGVRFLSERHVQGQPCSTPQTHQRVYGPLGVNSMKRIRRPGLLPDPRLKIQRRDDDDDDDDDKRSNTPNTKKRRSTESSEDLWSKMMSQPAKPTTPYSSNMSYQNLTDSPDGEKVTGFTNLGNTCYMNAVLQSLVHLPVYCDDMIHVMRQSKKRANSLVVGRLYSAVGKLIVLQGRAKMYLDTQRDCLASIKTAISKSAPNFLSNQQHDAHEFLAQLLDQIKSEVMELNKDLAMRQGAGEGMPGSEKAKPPTTPQPKPTPPVTPNKELTNPTVQNFMFGVLRTIQCLECGARVEIEEKFHDVSLDIPLKSKCLGERTIQDALESFFQDEHIDYNCEKCESKKGHITRTLTHLPRVLVIHLKRYTVSGCKMSGSIGIPRYVTLQSSCNQHTSPCHPPSLCSPGMTPDKDAVMIIDKENLGQRDTPRRKLDFKVHTVSNVNAEKYERSLQELRYHREPFAIAQMDGTTDPHPENTETDNQQPESMTEDSDNQEPESMVDQFDNQEPESMVDQFDNQEPESMVDQSDNQQPESMTEQSDNQQPEDMVDQSDTREERTGNEVGLSDPGQTNLQSAPTSFISMAGGVGEDDEYVFQMSPVKKDEDLQFLSAGGDHEVSLKMKTTADEDIEKALALSLQEQSDVERREKDDLQRAKELSLQELEASDMLQYLPDHEADDIQYVPADHDAEKNDERLAQKLQNAEIGDLPYSYRLVSVISHLGSSSAGGHYVSDVYNMKTKEWNKFDDSDVSKTTEDQVRTSRQQNGYIFFYIAKEVMDELGEFYQHGLDSPAVK